MENSYRFFQNRDCEYFPCHKGLTDFNCLFCYCPLYHETKCPGNPQFIENEGKRIKECSNCTFPHKPGNYDVIIQRLKERDIMM